MLILDHLLAGLRGFCATFPDARMGQVKYAMADVGMSAFSLFFMQSESFLAHQRSLEEGRKISNCRTSFGMANVPTDATIRSLLDEVPPSCLQGSFDEVLAVMRKHGMQAFERLGGRTLIAFDGTEFFCSQKLGCAHCQTRRRANGKTDFYHAMLAASIVAPGHAMVLPLMPEFITRQDGAEKQDCEREACKRWLLAHGARVKELRPIYLGDDLFACQPICAAVIAAGGDCLMTAKRQSHVALYDFMQGAALHERVIPCRQAGQALTCRYRWFNGAPLREGKDALIVDWLGVTITDAKGKLTDEGAFVTSLNVNAQNVAQIAACARARWKVENETFNVLENDGYHLEHDFGHGKHDLAMTFAAMTFAAMNLLAFAFHTVCDCLETLWQKAREAKRARKRLFEHIRTITAYLVFPDWQTLMTTPIQSKPPPEIARQISS